MSQFGDHSIARRQPVTLRLLIGFVAVASMTVLTACSRSRSGELDMIKQRVSATEVQAWAKQVLRDYPQGEQLLTPYFPGIAADASHFLSNPPTFLKAMCILGRGGPFISISPPGSNRCVSLLYHESPSYGGDGHEIQVGDETLSIATNAQCELWIPGVYYRYIHSH